MSKLLNPLPLPRLPTSHFPIFQFSFISSSRQIPNSTNYRRTNTKSQFPFLSLSMIRKVSNFSYLTTPPIRPFLTSALPLPLKHPPGDETTPYPNDPLPESLSLADRLISRGQFSTARKVILRVISSSSPASPQAISALDFASKRGLELGVGIYRVLIRKLVELGQFELAYSIYVDCLVGRTAGSDPGIVNSMVVCLIELGKFDEAKLLFDWLISGGCVPSQGACDGIILHLCGQEKFLEAFDCFGVICDGSSLELRMRVYNVLINGLCSKGCMAEARKVFVVLCERSGLLPTLHLFKSLFYGFCKKGLVSEAELVLGEMEDRGFRGDKVMYTSLINAYCKDKKMEMAMKVYLRMLRIGCEPDKFTYGTLIHGFVKLGLFDQAWEMYNSMNQSGVQPDSTTYHFMMKKYCMEGEVDCALALLGVMERRNLAPDLHCYTTLIAALSRVNRLSEVDELYKKLIKGGVVADHVLFFVFMKVMPNGRGLQLCLLMLQDIVKSGLGLDPSVLSVSPSLDVEREIEALLVEIAQRNLNLANVGFAMYICALCEGGKTDSALACLSKMINTGCSPLLFTFNSVVKCLSLDGLFEDVKSLINMMQEHSITPDHATYLVMVKEHCRRSNVTAAFDILSQMEERGLKPGVAIYDSIIGCLGRENKMFEAESLFRKMIDAGVDPDQIICTTMISAYCRNKRAEKARLFFEIMLKNSMKPSSHSYTALISGLVKSNMTEKACMYIHRMLEDGFDPNLVLYTSIIGHFLKKQEFEYAFRLVEAVDNKYNDCDSYFYSSLLCGICRNIFSIKKRHHLVNRASNRAKEKLLQLLGENSYLSWQNISRYSANSPEQVKCLVLKLVERIKESNVPLDLYLHNSLILGLCWADRMCDAYLQFDVMQREGMLPNKVTFTILIDAHNRNGEFDISLGLFNEMNASGFQPDKVTYKSLLKGLCIAGRGMDALCLLYAMHKRGFFPSKLCYDRLLRCLCFRGFSIVAFKVFIEMLEYGYIARPYSVKKLLSVLCEQNNLCEANMLFDILLSRGQFIDKLAKRQPLETSFEHRQSKFTFTV